MSATKKTFPCGHKGFGQSCHLCEALEAGTLVAYKGVGELVRPVKYLTPQEAERRRTIDSRLSRVKKEREVSLATLVEINLGEVDLGESIRGFLRRCEVKMTHNPSGKWQVQFPTSVIEEIMESDDDHAIRLHYGIVQLLGERQPVTDGGEPNTDFVVTHIIRAECGWCDGVEWARHPCQGHENCRNRLCDVHIVNRKVCRRSRVS